MNLFHFRHILYLVNIYYVIKILNNFKIGFKHNVVQIVIKQKQQQMHFLNGLKHLFNNKEISYDVVLFVE
jgi:RNA recognition motif-containing protein